MLRAAPLIAVLLTASPALSAGAPPAPGPSDTDALDTYLRRNTHTLKVKLIEHGGTGGKGVPVTMGLACGAGDFPAAKLCPYLAGEALPAQVDVLATWPADGSIRHALVSLVLPEVPPNGTLELSFRKAAPPKPGPFRPGMSLKDFVVRAELADDDGSKTVSQVPPEVLGRMERVLAGQAEPGALAPRLAGPICYEFEVHDTPQTAGKPDGDIDVFYRLRLYSGHKGVRIACVVENTRMPPNPYPKQWTHTDRDFKKLTFLAGAKGRPDVLYAHGPVTHWYGTRYRVLRWHGRRPAAIHAKQSFPYLIYSQFFPKLDIAHPLTAKQVARVAAGRGFAQARAPDALPDGPLLHHGPVYPSMPATGGRADIGPYATWHRLALASEAPLLDLQARHADGNGLASFPIHKRQGTALAPGLPYDDKVHPIYWDSARGRIARVRHRRGKNPCRHHPDQAHTPSAAYYAYLTTGEKFFEEELAFWAMYPSTNWPHKGLLPGTTRAQAWQLRNTTDAAFALPDGHPRKKYLNEYVRRNLAALKQALARDGHLLGGGQRKCSGRKNWVCARAGSIWMYTWLVWALDNAARKGFGEAAGIRDGAAELIFRLYEGTEEFKAPNGKVYRYDPRHAMPYQLALRLVQVEFRDDGREIDTDLGPITDNTGKMYYYNLLNNSHQYWFSRRDRDKYEAWKARHVTRKVMRPEDWKIDPAVEAKAAADPGSWHDYGNEACSAALGRYANPRARAMYKFVRAWMDKRRASRAGRLRGIEFVD